MQADIDDRIAREDAEHGRLRRDQVSRAITSNWLRADAIHL
jgi:hypothetical protein